MPKPTRNATNVANARSGSGLDAHCGSSRESSVPGEEHRAIPRKVKDKGRAASSNADEDVPRPAKKRKIEKAAAKSTVKVVFYDASAPVQETPLYLKLRELDTGDKLTRQFKRARKLQRELGSCAADLLWPVLLEDESLGQDDTLCKARDTLEKWPFDMPDVSPTSKRCNVSSHFAALVSILQSCATSDTFRGIVFVDKTITACLIAQLLRALDDELQNVRPMAFTRKCLPTTSQDETSTFRRFASGKYTLVVTDKPAAELDTSLANVLIHFNLEGVSARPDIETGPGERLLVYMAERANNIHAQLLQEYAIATDAVASSMPRPSSRDRDTEPPEINAHSFIEEPATGKRLYPKDAIWSICRYLDRLQPAGAQPLYTLRRSKDGTSLCHLALPSGNAVPEPLKRLASRYPEGASSPVCFLACQELFSIGLLNDLSYFKTPPAKETKTMQANMEESKAAALSSSTRCYPRRKASFWTRSMKSSVTRLYPLVVTVSPFKSGNHAPVVILTRSPLPTLPLPNGDSFSVFSNGDKATVRLQPGAPFDVDERQRDLFVRYTARIARTLVNKPVDYTAENLLYFFAPLVATWDDSPPTPWWLPDVHSHIDWCQVSAAVDHWAVPLVPEDGVISEESLVDCVIQDRAVEFTIRYYVTMLRRDLNPLSKPEPGSREAESATFLAYCESRRKDFQGLKDDRQPLLEVSQVPPIVNSLWPASKSTQSPVKVPAKFLIPEFCLRFVLPASTLRTALLLPSITHMIERMLVTKEMSVLLFDEKINEQHLLEAVTPISANVECDYERLELLGDTLLKQIMSAYFFVTMPGKREGALDHARVQAVRNRALYLNAMAAGLVPWIQSKALVPKLWSPCLPEEPEAKPENHVGSEPAADGDRVDGDQPKKKRSKLQRQRDEEDMQWLGDKNIADVVEAILGAAFHDTPNPIDQVLSIMKTLQFKMPEIETHRDFWRVYRPHATFITAPHNLTHQTIAALEEITGYTFYAPAILAEALTHGSAVNHQTTDYDRLEFLGDGILDFKVVWHNFQTYPNLSPGGLSLLKAAMVSNQTLSAIAVLTGLYKHIRCSSPGDMNASIQLYAHKILALRDEEYKLAKAENRLPTQFWTDVEPPKVLGDVVEAVVGAIYVSDRFEMHGVDVFFERVLKPFYDRHIRLHTLAKHPHTSLSEVLQAGGCHQHGMRKRTVERGMCSEVVVHETVLAGAVDLTTLTAMRKAAMAALDVLASDPGLIARICDCRSGNRAQKKKQQPHAALGYSDD